MSTTPKDPKDEGKAPGPGGGNAPRPNLNQTFLGVAPSTPPQKPSAPPQKSSESGSAIIAAPMIAISGKSPDKAAVPKPPPTPVPQAAGATQPPANLGGGWQSSNVAPGPSAGERTLMQAGPAPHPTPAPRPATRSPFPRPESKPPWAAAQPKPGGSDPHRTSLSSEYLRAAREAALGGLPPQAVAPQPVAPLAVTPQPAPQTQPPQSAPPPETAPPRAVAHIPMAVRHVAPAVSPAAYESTGPRSVGTQFSVAPPPEGNAEPPRGVARTVPQPIVHTPIPAAPPVAAAPAAQPAPRSIGGTMLEPAPSVAAPVTQPPAPASAFAAPASAGGFATRFEPVPSVRGPFSEQAPGALAPAASIEHSADWSRQNSQKAPATVAKSSASTPPQIRLIALAAVALGAIGFAVFGDQLTGGTAAVAERVPERRAQPGTADPNRAATAQTVPGQAAMANHPAGQNVASPSAGVAASTPPPSSALPTNPAPAGAEPAAEKGVKAGAESQAEAAPDEGGEPSDTTASPESQLAANAGRHVLAGRYAEALPLYQELKQKWPQTTAYAAMVRVLQQKVGAGSAAPAAAPATTPAKP